MRLITKIKNRLWSDEQTIILTESPLSILENETLVINKNVTIKKISDFLQFISILSSDISQKKKLLYNQRFNNGDYVYLLSIFGKYVSYLFVSTKNATFDQVGIKMKLPNKTLAIYDVNTSEGFRGSGYYKVLLSHVLSDLKKQGYMNFWLWVMPHNKLSINVHLKLNIKDVIMILKERYYLGFPLRRRKFVTMHLSDFL